jgi:hypothetical protein
MKKILFIISLFTSIAFAQDKVQISGKILDGEMNNEPLFGATVIISGTTTGAQADFDGKYVLEVAPGTYTFEYSYVGYVSVKETVNITADTTIDKILTANSLEQVIIVAETNREKESALLVAQKKAVGIKQQIGAQELAKKGASDVAAALTKASGISKQQGSGSIFVRGLGDRYNSTTLNGLPIPSNDPERKNISLDIFSTDIVQYIDINKIYNNSIYGDFGGANVNIASKNHKGKSALKFGYGSGYNFNALGENQFYLQDGPNYSGFYNKKYPNNALDAYNFSTGLDKERKNTPFNQDFSLSGGTKIDFKNDHSLSVFATGSFTNDYSFTEGFTRGNINADGLVFRDYDFKSYTYETNTTGMANLVYKFNSNHNLKFNSLYINSTSQNLSDYDGTIDVFDNASEGGGFVRRSTFNRTQLLVNQLLGEHKINDRLKFDWAGGYNSVLNNTPDRRQVMLVPSDNNNPLTSPKIVSDLATSDNHRYFEELKEDEISANIQGSYKFSKNEEDEYRGTLIAGYSGRLKNVNLEATQFNFAINRRADQPFVDIDNLDGYFNQESLDQGLFSIKTFRGNVDNALDPQTYEGIQIINSGFASIQYLLTPKLTGVFGVRGEQVIQKIEWKTSLDPNGDENTFDKIEIMPNASFKYELNDKQNLKLAASKSYTLPQFKERAPFLYESVEGSKFGNPFLYSSTNYNADLRWEYFPKSSEVISFTGFGKIIQNPINETIVSSAANDISWVNSGEQATVFGAEIELKKDLLKTEKTKKDTPLTSKLSLGLNGAFMITDQDFDSNKVQNETELNVFFTKSSGKITGASDMLLNSDISFMKELGENTNLLATLIGNYTSESIAAIGTNTKGNIINESLFTLDFVTKLKINKKLSTGISVKNILNPEIKRYQDNDSGKVEMKGFKRGINASISIQYNFL